MHKRDAGWIEILSRGDAEALWVKLYNLISKHSAVKNFYASNRFSYDRLKDVYSDLTQDLFLRLHEKARLQFYLDADYTDESVERELYRIEVPNLISHLLRERFPESYRLARRTSILLQTSPRFQYYTHPYSSSDGLRSFKLARASYKLVSQVYGLSAWKLDKPMKDEQQISELMKEVAFRMRDNRRTGRGSGSQVIISNEELAQLIVDIFTVIDSPADVRTIRQLVLSKLAIEDSRFISIDAGPLQDSLLETDMPPVDLADQRPTPEDLLIEKETTWQAAEMAEGLLTRMKEAVKNKPSRYSKLLSVVWHCYYNPSQPSQTSVARSMGISDSLVSHYRKIFDTLIQSLELCTDEFKLLNSALNDRLKAMVEFRGEYGCDNKSAPATRPLYVVPRKPLSFAASTNSHR